MENKIFKKIFFLLVLSVIFIGGEALAASCKFPLPVFGTWPAQSMSDATVFCLESSNLLKTYYNDPTKTNLGRIFYDSTGWAYNMSGSDSIITNSTVYPFSGYPLRTYFVWQCTDFNGLNATLCNATTMSSACGSASGGSFNSAPSSNLCISGTTASSVSYTTGIRIPVDFGSYKDYSYVYYWTCTNSGNTGQSTRCFARANRQPTVNAGTDKTVNEGQSISFSDATASDYFNDTLTYSWSCTGGSLSNANSLNPIYTAPLVSANTNYSCTLTANDGNLGIAADSLTVTVNNVVAVVNGSCGTSNGQTFTSTPSTNLCSTGTASSVTSGTTTYTWTCAGSGGGTTASCGATRNYLVIYDANGGTCTPTSRTVSYNTTAAAPSCSRTGYTLSSFTRTSGSGGTLNTSTGAVTNVTGNQTIQAGWTVAVVNGSCGTANGQTFTSVPSSNLCSAGTASSVTSGTTTYTWSCAGSGGGTTANCSATRNYLVTYDSNGGSCTPTSRTVSYNTTAAAPSCSRTGYTLAGFTRTSGSGGTLNTSTGAVTNVTGNQTIRADWTAATNGSCGAANGHGYYSTSEIDTSAERCAAGTFTSFTDAGSTYTWSCTGSGGGTTANCSAMKVAAGSASGQTRRDEPTTNLCTYGTATSRTLISNIWYWSCTNNPGVDAAGYTYKTTCGSSNGGTFSIPPTTNLCTYGTASSVTTNPTTYTWTCTGNDSLAVSCSANKSTPTVNGSCGSSNGGTFSSAPTANLCLTGTASSVTTNPTTYIWSCTGSGGGTTANCSATRTVSSTFNACGTANNRTYLATDTSWGSYTQCSSGTSSSAAFPVAGNSAYWSCSVYVCLADNQEYDPVTNTWTTKSSMNIARRGYGTAVVNGKIYIMGGVTGSSTSLNSIEEYDPLTDIWTDKGTMPQNMWAFSTAVVNNKIYVMGGNSDSGVLGTNYEYDPSTNTWTTKASMPQTSYGHSAAMYNNKIYIAGGFNMASTYLNRTIEYDPLTNTWTTKASMPYRVSMNALFTANNKIYSVGGFSDVSGTWQDITNVQEYNPSTNTWTTKAPMSFARSNLFGAVINNKIYVTGGFYTGIASPAFNNFTTEEYDPSTNTWTTKANSQIARNANGICSVAAVNNKMYVIGGYGAGTCSASREAEAVVNGSCGTANGHGYYSTSEIDTSAERCAAGTFTSFTDAGSTYTWSCTGLGGGTTASCSAMKVAAGSASGQTRRDEPTTNLCTYGTATSRTLISNIWYWSCTNNPGVDAVGYTYKTTCGSSNGGTFSSAPTTNLCTYGTASSVTTNPTTYTWTCTGNDSLAVSCSATRTGGVINGSCGTDNGKVLTSTPTNLCSTGTPSSVSGTGPWSWTCNGSGGGTTANCNANKITFNNPFDLISDENCWYCEHYLDGLGVLQNGKMVDGRAVLELNFVLTTSSFTSYKIGIGTNNTTPSMETTDWLPFSGTSATFNGLSVIRGATTDSKPSNNSFYITYGTGTAEKTYYWFVKLTGDTAWRLAGSFNTPKKPFPIVRIAADKANVTIGTNIQYCATIPSLTATTDACYSVCWKGTGTPTINDLVPGNTNWKCSICYDNLGQPALCTTTGGQNDFSWDLPINVGQYVSSAYDTPNPIFKYTSSIGLEKPGLVIHGSDCAAEGDTGTISPLPRWRETN